MEKTKGVLQRTQTLAEDFDFEGSTLKDWSKKERLKETGVLVKRKMKDDCSKEWAKSPSAKMVTKTTSDV